MTQVITWRIKYLSFHFVHKLTKQITSWIAFLFILDSVRDQGDDMVLLRVTRPKKLRNDVWILWEAEVIKSPSLQLCPERFFIKTAGKQQLHKVQQRELQSPAPGQERPQVPEQGGTAGKQLCRSSHGRPGGQQFEHKPAMCPYSKSYIRKSISSKPKEVNLLSSAIERSHLHFLVQPLAPQYSGSIDILGWVQ